MQLQKPFCRLPLRFDAARLQAEVAAAPAAAWNDHPDDYPGNKALRLITVGGTENDGVAGAMAPTPHLEKFPYLQQVLASFGVVWSRSRLMKLGAGGSVPLHCDIKYHWTHRVRVHIPIVTNPEVKFTCGGESVHMAAGEAWIFDNWRPHSVTNGSKQDRIHLVADTMGNEHFWQVASRGQWERFGEPQEAPRVDYQPGVSIPLLTERFNAPVVMPPAELEVLVNRLIGDISPEGLTDDARPLAIRTVRLLQGFCSEWRQLWSLLADHPDGWPHYLGLRKQLRTHMQRSGYPMHLRSNGALFMDALQQGVLRHVLNLPAGTATEADEPATGAKSVRLSRPLFIVAAPRSGSTLLFETLAESKGLCNLGGEAHHLVEQFAALQPGGGSVDSNRLTAEQLTPDIAQAMHETIFAQLRGADGKPPAGPGAVRLLEKTPKNALRIPFFKALFPDAQFIFLWREPQENLSSIMEAWRSGGYVMYPALDGVTKPWSLLLPPGWREVRDRPLEEIAAFQWRASNQVILDDLAALPAKDWMSLSYADLVADPARAVRRVCEFAGLEFDERLNARVAAPLPVSRHTLTAPEAGKWRKNEGEIARVLPALEPVLARLKSLPG